MQKEGTADSFMLKKGYKALHVQYIYIQEKVENVKNCICAVEGGKV